jgi:phosphoadenosine phosphosulfate reductase
MSIDIQELKAKSLELENSPPAEILRYAIARYPNIAISTAFGPEGCALVHLASTIKNDIKVFTIDTDFLFPESIELRQLFVDKYRINLTVLKGEVTLEEQNRRHGLNLWQRDTDRCCALRKVEPTGRALVGLDAWVAGLRRDQSPTRAAIDVLELYEAPPRRGTSSAPLADELSGPQSPETGPLVKVNPLVNWTRKDTWDYLLGHDVPYNVLLDQGYTSIGCWPCTRTVGGDEDERAGRWDGQKTECGIHTFMARKG